MKLTGPKRTIKRAKQLRASMSLPEVILWRALRRNQAGHRFRRQHPAGTYILDFYCDSARLCVEVDGEAHGFRLEHDRRRDHWLTEQGVRTLRIAGRDVLADLDAVVRQIMMAAESPSVALCAPPPPEGED